MKQLAVFIEFDSPNAVFTESFKTSWLRSFQTKVTYFLMSQKTMLTDETGEALTFGWLANSLLSTPRSCQSVCNLKITPPLDDT